MRSAKTKGHISKKKEKTFFSAFLTTLRKRKIIQTLAAFIGGGWLVLEFVHWILIDHYHFPELTLDIIFIILICALICTLIWQWFRGVKKPRKIKAEFILIPLIILITAFFGVRFIQQIGEPEAEVITQSRWKNSIAVLPFVNISAEEEQEYFCDGLTEELINRLSNIKELKVPARTSAFAFKGKEIDIREVGQKLNVDKVLEGSVRKTGNRIRITAQLINIADGYHLWSEKYDRKLEDIFVIQDEISLAIVDKLRVNLLGEEKVRLVKHHTEDLDAYDLYLKGRYFQNREDPERVRKAKMYYEQAISRDPNFAPAYAGLAYAFWMLGFQSDLEIGVAALKAREAAEKALELDEASAEAHTSIGVIYEIFDWNWKKAEQEFRRAIELNINSMEAHHEYNLLLSRMGRFKEAEVEMRLAQELDPLSSVVKSGIILVYLWSRQYDRIIKEFQVGKTCDHSDIIGFAYAQKDMHEKAIEVLETCLAYAGRVPISLGTLGYVYGISGKGDEARRLIDELKGKAKQANVSYFIAWCYSGLGETEQALVWLERAYEERSPMFSCLKGDPYFDSFRSDPRFKTLLNKIGLDE